MLQLAHRYVRARPSTAVHVDASSHHVVFLRVYVCVLQIVCVNTRVVCVYVAGEAAHMSPLPPPSLSSQSVSLPHTLRFVFMSIAHLVFHLSAFVCLYCATGYCTPPRSGRDSRSVIDRSPTAHSSRVVIHCCTTQDV